MTAINVINTVVKIGEKVLIPEIYYKSVLDDCDKEGLKDLQDQVDFVSQWVGTDNWDVAPEPFFLFEEHKAIRKNGDNDYVLIVTITQEQSDQYKEHLRKIGTKEEELEYYMRAGMDVNLIYISFDEEEYQTTVWKLQKEGEITLSEEYITNIFSNTPPETWSMDLGCPSHGDQVSEFALLTLEQF